jgi:hypothetical protein
LFVFRVQEILVEKSNTIKMKKEEDIFPLLNEQVTGGEKKIAKIKSENFKKPFMEFAFEIH